MKRRAARLLLPLLLFVGTALRVVHPSADPPATISWSQGESTDPFWYLEAALERLATGTWQPRQNYNKYIFSWLAYLIFALFGVGIPQANAISLLPGVGMVLLLYLSLRQIFPQPWALLGGALAAFNAILAAYSTIPVIYPTLTAAMVLAWYLWVVGKGEGWMVGITFVWLVAVVLYLKEIALLLLPVFLLGILLRAEGRAREVWLRRGIGGGLLVLLFLGGYARYNPEFWHHVTFRFFQYRQESLGLQGFLHELFTFGRIEFFDRMPILAFGAYLALWFLLVGRAWREGGKGEREVLPALWLWSGVAGFVLLHYRPLRYMLVLIPPMILLAVAAARRIWEGELPRGGKGEALLLTAWSLPLCYRLLGRFIPLEADGFLRHLALALLLASLATLLFSGSKGAWRRLPEGRRRLWRRTFVVVALLLSLAVQLRNWVRWECAPTWSIVRATEEIPVVVGKNASLVGAYAHLLAFGNPYPHHRLRLDPRLDHHTCETFVQGGFTHFTADTVEAIPTLVRHFPELLRCTTLVDTFYIRGFAVDLLRIDVASGYTPTPFEVGRMRMAEQDWDAAAEIFLRLRSRYPASSLVLRNLGIAEFHRGRFEAAARAFEEALSRHRSDPQAAFFLGMIHANRGNGKEALAAWRQAYRAAVHDPIFRRRIEGAIEAYRRGARAAGRQEKGGVGSTGVIDASR